MRGLKLVLLVIISHSVVTPAFAEWGNPLMLIFAPIFPDDRVDDWDEEPVRRGPQASSISKRFDIAPNQVPAGGYGLWTSLPENGVLNEKAIRDVMTRVETFQRATAADTSLSKVLKINYFDPLAKDGSAMDIIELESGGTRATEARLRELAASGRSIKSIEILRSTHEIGTRPAVYARARWFPAMGAVGAVIGLERLLNNGGAYAKSLAEDCPVKSKGVNCESGSVAKRLLRALPAEEAGNGADSGINGE